MCVIYEMVCVCNIRNVCNLYDVCNVCKVRHKT